MTKSAQVVIADYIWENKSRWDLDDMGLRAGAEIMSALSDAGYLITKRPGIVEAPCEHCGGFMLTYPDQNKASRCGSKCLLRKKPPRAKDGVIR